MIKEEKATVYIARLYCDLCGEEMSPSGMIFATEPPKYEHTCINNHKKTLPERYPKTIAREDGER